MCPQKIALLTDSCADIAPELAAENHIYVVPLRILCSDGEYQDGVNIFNTDIYRYLQAGELPKTSLPSTEDFGKVMEQIIADFLAEVVHKGFGGNEHVARGFFGELTDKAQLLGGVHKVARSSVTDIELS